MKVPEYHSDLSIFLYLAVIFTWVTAVEHANNTSNKYVLRVPSIGPFSV